MPAERWRQRIIARERIMKRICVCIGLCSVFLLQGCFEGSNDAPNKDGDKSKASLQIQKDKAPEQGK
ncbi:MULTISPECIES: hypothetical protein [unclassified Pseudomonas]|nr:MULTISPECIES: hypothetical protein [unclassified Pseudomonas]MDI2142329.1 hypothetical protein [Pseudomonas sp. ITA]